MVQNVCGQFGNVCHVLVLRMYLPDVIVAPWIKLVNHFCLSRQ